MFLDSVWQPVAPGTFINNNAKVKISISPLCMAVVHSDFFATRALWDPQGLCGLTNWQEDVWDKDSALPFDWCVISAFFDSPHLTVIISIETVHCICEIMFQGDFKVCEGVGVCFSVCRYRHQWAQSYIRDRNVLHFHLFVSDLWCSLCLCNATLSLP